jgi:hypothetical protein
LLEKISKFALKGGKNLLQTFERFVIPKEIFSLYECYNRSLNLHQNVNKSAKGEKFCYKSYNNLRHTKKKMQHTKKNLATKSHTIRTDHCL